MKNKVTVKRTISMSDFIAFVNTVTAISTDENGNYSAAYEQIGLRYAVTKYLTDKEIGDDIQAVFEATNEPWYSDVLDKLNTTTYWSNLITAIDNARKTSFDRLCDKASLILDKVAEVNAEETVNTLSAIAEKLNLNDNITLAHAVADHAIKKADA